MDKSKFLRRLDNNQKNVLYEEFVTLIEGFGFSLFRTVGNHHVYGREDVRAMVNAHNDNGLAKPYQIKQFLGMIEIFDIKMDVKMEEE